MIYIKTGKAHAQTNLPPPPPFRFLLTSFHDQPTLTQLPSAQRTHLDLLLQALDANFRTQHQLLTQRLSLLFPCHLSPPVERPALVSRTRSNEEKTSIHAIGHGYALPMGAEISRNSSPSTMGTQRNRHSDHVLKTKLKECAEEEMSLRREFEVSFTASSRNQLKRKDKKNLTVEDVTDLDAGCLGETDKRSDQYAVFVPCLFFLHRHLYIRLLTSLGSAPHPRAPLPFIYSFLLARTPQILHIPLLVFATHHRRLSHIAIGNPTRMIRLTSQLLMSPLSNPTPHLTHLLSSVLPFLFARQVSRHGTIYEDDDVREVKMKSNLEGDPIPSLLDSCHILHMNDFLLLPILLLLLLLAITSTPKKCRPSSQDRLSHRLIHLVIGWLG